MSAFFDWLSNTWLVNGVLSIGNVLFEFIGGGIMAIIHVLGRIIESLAEFIVDVALDIAGSIINGIDQVSNLFNKTLDDIPNLLTSFEEFLIHVFPFMPPEFVNLISLGIILLAAVAIIKVIIGIFV
jgi:hypothetical protein